MCPASAPLHAASAAYAAAIENLSLLIPELLTLPGVNGAPPTRRKFSLDQIGLLTAALGNPQHNFPSILIAGTNGKGSTAATLASIARAAGLRVGLYTSPHLERVNERIRLGDATQAIRDIEDETFARLYFQTHDAAQQLVLDGALPALPSYFELLTALAFLYFSESQIDLAVLEVGMGGRLDATNIVSPILSVITDISLDHQEWLGSTIDRIAREKAGILRPNGILITLPQHPEANQALGEVAASLNVRGVNAAQYMPALHTDPIHPYPLEVLGAQITVDSPLKGAHQHRNIALAIATAVELAQNPHLPRSFPIAPQAVEQGIQATHWPGRFEHLMLPNHPGFVPEVVLDVAHNPAGAWALRATLSADQPSGSNGIDSTKGDSPHAQVLIFACLRDKPLREMTQILFPIFDHVLLAPIHSPRATEVADLLEAACSTGVPTTAASTVPEAIQLALRLNPARIVVSGSLYLVGEARHLLLADAKTPEGAIR